MNKSYYDILGLNPTGFAVGSKVYTTKEIRTAYFKLAKKYHTDKKGGDKQKFHALTEAYTILSNVETRAEHDEILRNNPELVANINKDMFVVDTPGDLSNSNELVSHRAQSINLSNLLKDANLSFESICLSVSNSPELGRAIIENDQQFMSLSLIEQFILVCVTLVKGRYAPEQLTNKQFTNKHFNNRVNYLLKQANAVSTEAFVLALEKEYVKVLFCIYPAYMSLLCYNKLRYLCYSLEEDSYSSSLEKAARLFLKTYPNEIKPQHFFRVRKYYTENLHNTRLSQIHDKILLIEEGIQSQTLTTRSFASVIPTLGADTLYIVKNLAPKYLKIAVEAFIKLDYKNLDESDCNYLIDSVDRKDPNFVNLLENTEFFARIGQLADLSSFLIFINLVFSNLSPKLIQYYNQLLLQRPESKFIIAKAMSRDETIPMIDAWKNPELYNYLFSDPEDLLEIEVDDKLRTQVCYRYQRVNYKKAISIDHEKYPNTFARLQVMQVFYARYLTTNIPITRDDFDLLYSNTGFFADLHFLSTNDNRVKYLILKAYAHLAKLPSPKLEQWFYDVVVHGTDAQKNSLLDEFSDNPPEIVLRKLSNSVDDAGDAYRVLVTCASHKLWSKYVTGKLLATWKHGLEARKWDKIDKLNSYQTKVTAYKNLISKLEHIKSNCTKLDDETLQEMVPILDECGLDVSTIITINNSLLGRPPSEIEKFLEALVYLVNSNTLRSRSGSQKTTEEEIHLASIFQSVAAKFIKTHNTVISGEDLSMLVRYHGDSIIPVIKQHKLLPRLNAFIIFCDCLGASKRSSYVQGFASQTDNSLTLDEIYSELIRMLMQLCEDLDKISTFDFLRLKSKINMFAAKNKHTFPVIDMLLEELYFEQQEFYAVTLMKCAVILAINTNEYVFIQIIKELIDKYSDQTLWCIEQYLSKQDMTLSKLELEPYPRICSLVMNSNTSPIGNAYTQSLYLVDILFKQEALKPAQAEQLTYGLGS